MQVLFGVPPDAPDGTLPRELSLKEALIVSMRSMGQKVEDVNKEAAACISSLRTRIEDLKSHIRLLQGSEDEEGEEDDEDEEDDDDDD